MKIDMLMQLLMKRKTPAPTQTTTWFLAAKKWTFHTNPLEAKKQVPTQHVLCLTWVIPNTHQFASYLYPQFPWASSDSWRMAVWNHVLMWKNTWWVWENNEITKKHINHICFFCQLLMWWQWVYYKPDGSENLHGTMCQYESYYYMDWF